MISIITTQYGLLDVLVSNEVLTYGQVSLIKEKDSSSGQVIQLLEEITRQFLSEGRKEAFLNALDQTHQKHVSNYLRGKGKRAAEYGDDWPLYYGTESHSITVNNSKLIGLIDPRNGLMDEIFSAECINNIIT